MIWYVALGSAVGGMSRYLIGLRLGHAGFPWATLAINISGSFLLGILLRVPLLPSAMSPEVRAMLTVGLCGGFTTFSTFTAETIRLAQDGVWSKAVGYVAASVLLGLLAGLAGLAIGGQLFGQGTT
ncbi:MAG: fluoride efflux transporter CrcB [Gemmatimonadota bacterium]|nr:fluoride efflux transporter CrcB [Gemmatimonadota bacterium]